MGQAIVIKAGGKLGEGELGYWPPGSAPFVSSHIIETTEVAFDDFAGGKSDVQQNRRILGLS